MKICYCYIVSLLVHNTADALLVASRKMNRVFLTCTNQQGFSLHQAVNISHNSSSFLSSSLSYHQQTIMAEDIAREIIAQSRGGSKLAFSFINGSGGSRRARALLYMSRDANEKARYHVVHKGRNDATGQCNEFKYSNLKGAMALVKTFIQSSSQSSYATVKVVLCKNGIDCEGEELASLGRLDPWETGFIDEMVNILDTEVVNMTPMEGLK